MAGYNGGFGYASAFFIEVSSPTSASISNAALLRARIPSTAAVLSALFSSPDILALLYLLASTSPNGAHSWLNLSGVLNAGRLDTEYTLACSQAEYFPIKLERYPAKTFMNMNENKIEIGKYLVSPLAREQGEGRYAASVSIRSGRGSGTHDRVLRFNGLFDSAAAALHYATEHAMGWIRERSSPICA